MVLFMLLSRYLCSIGKQGGDKVKRIRKLIINYGISYVLFFGSVGLDENITGIAYEWRGAIEKSSFYTGLFD